MIPREEEAANDLTTKQNNTINTKNPKPSKPNSSLTSTTTTTTTTTTKSSWSKFEDPRIVRVSKAHGGKDRHSKVCTVRGLRDRRVRLSVPTAIQLYDLQDRLGFNQPSKVVDWLLNAAKQEIDELPPLQIPQGFSFIGQNLHHHHHPILPTPHHHQGIKISGNFDSHPLIKHPRSSATTSERNDDDDEEERERGLHMENNQGSDHHHQYVCTSNFVPRQNPSSSNSFVRWDSSNLTLSRPESTAHQHQDNLQNFSLVQPLSHHHHHQNHQVVVYQHGMSTQLPYFSPQISPTNAVFDSKQPSFHGLELQNSSTHQVVRPFPFSMVSDLLPSQSKRDELHSSQP